MTQAPWPFEDPLNVITVTTRHVVDGSHPIDYVSRDEEDGGWQFHTNAVAFSMADALLVRLDNMVARDASLLELADLPLGWCAVRSGPSAPWVRAPVEEDAG